MKYEHLFAPLKIRGMELKNRVILPAMGCYFTDGHPNNRSIAYFKARAEGGCALITPEATSVYGPGAPDNFLNISADEYIPSFKKMTDEIHAAGSKMCVQLWEGGITPMFFDQKCIPIIPSDLMVDMVFGNPLPQALPVPGTDVETIHAVVHAFGQAARRAVQAGFDTIEYHLAHGYMPHMFLSPAFNKRTDEYGGNRENRYRFPMECIRAIRANMPEDMPLIIRIDSCDDDMEGGMTIDDVIDFLNVVKTEGVDAVNVSRGNPVSAAMRFEVPAIDLERGFNVEYAAKIKADTGLLTIATGRINNPDIAEEIIASGKADMVVVGRGQLADPEFCNKAASGREDDIIRCVGCMQGCMSNGDVPYFTCVRNPLVGKEQEVTIEKAEKAKTVVVAGGGMGGLEAAATLIRRGHKVIVLEETEKTGGMFAQAGFAPGKIEMREAALSRGPQVARMGVDIRVNTKATPEVLAGLEPDEVIIATGARTLALKVPGADGRNVYNVLDVLEGKVKLKGNIVVIGGGLVGMEAAEYLAAEDKDNKITVVEMLDGVARDLAGSRKYYVNKMVEEYGINIRIKTKCMECKEDAVVVDTEGIQQSIPCDAVVVAIGMVSKDYSDISSYCESNNIPYHVIGNALKAPRNVTNAIHEGFYTALEI